jgi:hypothetical protein
MTVVARLGAFAETCLAVERSHTAGLHVGANVFVTKGNLPRIAEFAVALQNLRLDEMNWEPASFTPTPRGRQFEPQRPALQDLQPHVETILSCTNMSRDRWPALDDYTEAAHRQRALDGDWPTYDPPARSEVGLVCRPDLDVYIGMPGVLRERLGYPRADGPEVVLERAIAHGPLSDDALYFGTDDFPSLPELAARFGDPAGQAVHFWFGSGRRLWCDRAASARRRDSPEL